MHRSWGGLIAGGLFVLPSLLILIALSWVYMAWGQVPAVAGVLYGIKPAVTAIVVSAAVRIGSRTLKNRWLWAWRRRPSGHLRAGPAVPAHRGPGGGGGLPGRAAGAGPVRGGRRPRCAAGLAGAGGDRRRHAHAGPCALLLAGLLACGGGLRGLWALALGALVWAWGWDGVLTQMAWFFTKAALLTFGGAYAVLPYVYQGAVDHFHWLTPGQMIDGLALGETTPGPLIMVVSYVGFVGGWGQALFGPQALPWAGVAAAAVVTFFTFLPSFFFIFLGAPFIESTHGKLQFTAPLTAITAAVVGVIVNLAVFFAYHVLWPRGWAGGFEWAAAVIGLAAALALLRFKVG
jgi:chromate transporter